MKCGMVYPIFVGGAIITLFCLSFVATAFTTETNAVPLVNMGVLRDPTGTYTFSLLPNGAYSMNLTAYEKLLQDPYSAISNASLVQINGNTVVITPPVSDVVS